MELNTKPLKILSASAGSGKTFNLVMTYLKLILSEEENASAFSSIMSMTFTNKAASEMKSRIIEALDVLSNTDFINKTEENSKQREYLSFIASEFKLSENLVQLRAKKVLKQILHQYENFNVLTIDKFNLRLIRSFSRDLNINTDFQTTTNEKDVLGEIVDQLFSEINHENYQKLTEIVLRYSKENSEEELKWDFKGDLKSLAEILIKEQNFAHIQTILEQDFSLEAYDELKTKIRILKLKIEEKAKDLYQTYFSFDTSKFPGGTNTDKGFQKLISDELFSLKYEKFFSPTILTNLETDPKGKVFPDEIKQKGLDFVAFYFENRPKYVELTTFKKNFFNIAILQLIAKELDNYKKSDNIVLISEFNKLISDLLKNEDAPYIYERIGNRYKHFLLDEFQDTSLLQWTNLIPLVHESLSYGQENLIVGDPKQSIYRFKNGLAEQFVDLPKIYNPENDENLAHKSAYFEKMGIQLPLEDNWRSKKEIVEFNNLFFEHFRDLENDLLKDFYKDIHQNPKGESGGYVYFESEILSKNKAESSEDEEEDEIEELSFLLDWIQECKNDGYDNGDICILGYQSKSCNQWATYLGNNGFKVVSADSLLLGSDPFVKLILAYIKWRVNPIGELEAKLFSEMYFDLKIGNSIVSLEKYWKEREYEGKMYAYFDATKFVEDEFVSEENFFFHYENLYQLVQKFLLLADLKELNNPYLHQFSDYVFTFDLNFGPDLALFVERFYTDGIKIAVQIPENKDAIKIMTAHKSKGLEFPIVLVPSMNWQILMSQSKFLIQDKEHYFYTSLKKDSILTSISEFHLKEYSQAYLDKINLNYVVFTRPKDRLYIRNVSSRKKSENNYERKVHDVINSLPNIIQKEERIVFELGQKTKKINSVSEIETPIFSPEFVADNLWFPDISLQDSNLIEDEVLTKNRRFGNQLHEILSLVNDSSELEKTINQLFLKGKIELEFKDELSQKSKEILNLSSYLDLFQDSKSILREQDIIISATQTKRPDLIITKANETFVVDYKTGVERSKHLKQVKEYCSSLKEMNFPNVKGFVFYTSELRILEVVV
ncbi:MAG: UvrD-helicase domain-containing protein [Bacteroidota bacterium]